MNVGAYLFAAEYQTGATLRVWSGIDTLIFEGQEYQGVGGVLQAGQIEGAIGSTLESASVTIAIPDALKSAFQNDIGAVPVAIIPINSTSGGAAWVRTGFEFRGVMSDGDLRAGTFTLRLATIADDETRGSPVYWSEAAQRRRFPDDSGFRRVDAIANNGIDVAWPRTAG